MCKPIVGIPAALKIDVFPPAQMLKEITVSETASSSLTLPQNVVLEHFDQSTLCALSFGFSVSPILHLFNNSLSASFSKIGFSGARNACSNLSFSLYIVASSLSLLTN